MSNVLSTSQQLAKHFKEVYFGGNWTWSNLKDNLKDVSWKDATTQVEDINTIATLVFHIHYFTLAITNVLKGNPLDAKDKYSFDHPPINSKEDWNTVCSKIFSEAEEFITLVEQIPDQELNAIFSDKKYGSYFRNLLGLIEHTHYHLGQIALIKKLLKK